LLAFVAGTNESSPTSDAAIGAAFTAHSRAARYCLMLETFRANSCKAVKDYFAFVFFWLKCLYLPTGTMVAYGRAARQTDRHRRKTQWHMIYSPTTLAGLACL
jgi:hypothetical protein